MTRSKPPCRRRRRRRIRRRRPRRRRRRAAGAIEMNKRIAVPFRAGAFLLMASALVACTPSESPQQWVAREKAKKGAPLAPLPVIKTFEVFIYKDQDLRDPFGLSAEEQDTANATGPHPDQNRPREPLESFPLDGLKMSGTLGSA